MWSCWSHVRRHFLCVYAYLRFMRIYVLCACKHVYDTLTRLHASLSQKEDTAFSLKVNYHSIASSPPTLAPPTSSTRPWRTSSTTEFSWSPRPTPMFVSTKRSHTARQAQFSKTNTAYSQCGQLRTQHSSLHARSNATRSSRRSSI